MVRFRPSVIPRVGQRVKEDQSDRARAFIRFPARPFLMLQALGDAEPTPPLPPALTSTTTVSDTSETAVPRKRKKTSLSFDTTLSSPMGKELSASQKAIVKMNVTRETADGVVKCCYCEKEISSKNIDRWASHLRGCVKAPEEVKAQIQPLRTATTPPPAATTAAAAGLHTTPVLNAATMNAFAAHAAAGQLGTLTTSASANETFKVHVSKDYMKFNAAHFIAHKGFREKLHGHNYQLAVTITGVVGPDGYVVDFGDIKNISRVICKDLNESFLVPMNSDVLKITFDGTNVHILTEDMAKFSFPKADCSLLPIIHSSAEELAIYISNQIVDAFTLEALLGRGVRKLEVSIAEASKQFASYERTIGLA